MFRFCICEPMNMLFLFCFVLENYNRRDHSVGVLDLMGSFRYSGVYGILSVTPRLVLDIIFSCVIPAPHPPVLSPRSVSPWRQCLRPRILLLHNQLQLLCVASLHGKQQQGVWRAAARAEAALAHGARLSVCQHHTGEGNGCLWH